MKAEFVNGCKLRKGLQGNATRYGCYLLSVNPGMPVTKFKEAVCAFSDISVTNASWLTKEDPADPRLPTGKLWTRANNGARGYLTLHPNAAALIGTHVTPEEFCQTEKLEAMSGRGLIEGSLVTWTSYHHVPYSNTPLTPVKKTGMLVNTKCRGRKTVDILCNGMIERVVISSLENINFKEEA